MPELPHAAYSWRADPAVSAFDDGRPLIVFDGVCVLCSSGAAFVMRHDAQGLVNLASAQSPLGEALYRHFGLDFDESYLVLSGGRAFTSQRPGADCVAGWRRDAARFVPAGREAMIDELAGYYVDTRLRSAPEERTRYCHGGSG